jgi:integrase
MPRFTDRHIASLKIDTGRIEIKDDACRGLTIRVTPTRKTWAFRFKRNGRTRRITLGEYPTMTLAQANVAANTRRADLLNGRNPIAEQQKDERAKVVTSDELTFATAADRFEVEYLSKQKSGKSAAWYLGLARKEFERSHLSALKRDEIVKFLRRLAAHSIYNANRTQSVVCRMYNWLHEEDETVVNPIDGVPKQGGQEHEKERVLSDSELRRAWPALLAPDAPMTEAVGIALRLIFLTAQRPVQVSGMRLDELVGLDTRDPWWELPAKRMKRWRRPAPHSVPFSPEAVRLVKRAISLRTGEAADSAFVFPSPTNPQKPIERQALSKAVERLRTKLGMQDWTPHDGRRSATTWARAAGSSREVTDALTHHTIPGAARIYDRYHMAKEKRDAVIQIARHVEKALGTGKRSRKSGDGAARRATIAGIA